MRQPQLVIAAGLTGVLLLGGCRGQSETSGAGSGATTQAPSPAAYCAVMNRYKQRYLSQFSTANAKLDQTDDGAAQFTGLLYAVMAIGDLRPMWHDMAAVAPPEIKEDTQSLADAWDKEMDNAVGDPLHPAQAMAKNLAVALTVLGPATRVNSYVATHCDR